MDRQSLGRHVSLVRSWRNDRAARGFSVTLELAYRCNLRCVFCSRWNDPDDLSLAAVEGIAADMARLGAGYVSLSGGDPFVRPDIEAILDAFVARHVPIHINTNGVLLGRYAAMLRERASSIIGVTVSIDSPVASVHDDIRGVSGTFDRALDGMARIRDVIPVSLACTLNQRNLAEIEPYAAFARSLGYPFRFQPLHEDGTNRLTPNRGGVSVAVEELAGLPARLDVSLEPNAPFAMRQYYRLFEPFFRDREKLAGLRCSAAARLIYFVDPKGDVFPCDTRRDIPLGNVSTTGLAAIVEGEASSMWRATCRRGENRCWCMYACVAPHNVRNQDLPLVPLTSSGWPLAARWRRPARLGEGTEPPTVVQPLTPDAVESWPPVAVVVASFNGGARLIECLRNILALEYPRDRLEIVLVDDGSNDGSVEGVRREMATEMASNLLRIVRNDTPHGVAAAYNRGVGTAHQHARYIFKLDNDAFPRPDALRNLVMLAEANPRAGILGGSVYFHDQPSRLQSFGGFLTSRLRGPALVVNPSGVLAGGVPGDVRILDVINSCMSLFRRSVFEQVGLFPEFYGRYEYEDYDLAFRARKGGFLSMFCPTAAATHAVSHTSVTNRLTTLRIRQRARNGVLFMRRNMPWRRMLGYLVYHLAKLPLDAVRHRVSPVSLLRAYLGGLFTADADRELTRLQVSPLEANRPNPLDRVQPETAGKSR